jgi:Tol biopolymer transport system component
VKPAARLAATALVLAGMAWAGACHVDRLEGPQGPDSALSVIVSDPVSQASAAGVAAPAIVGTPGPDHVYVSLPPGAVPHGDVATIRNRRTRGTALATLVGGGFDPILVEAGAGDTLDLTITLTGSGTPTHLMGTVPPNSRPVVVRTDPPPRHRDVPLNATMLIVFSEPIEARTLNASSIQLRSGGSAVAGRLEFLDSAHVTAALVPAAPLNGSSDYQLLITASILDTDGDPLQEPVTVDFSTVAGPPAGRIAFVRNGSIYLINPDGTGATRLTDSPSDGEPAWSRDGTRLAFTRTADIYALNADGSGLTRLTTNTGPATSNLSPAWSPDGTRLAFASGRAGNYEIYVMNADGTGVTRLTNDPAFDLEPAWSPDGSSIAFMSRPATFVGAPSVVRVMNADGSGIRTIQSDAMDPAWSPDGAHITYLWGGTIWVMNADGSGATRLVGNSLFGGGRTAWSADGRQLAFSGGTGDGTNNPELYVMNADGSGLVRLTVDSRINPSADYGPAWSPARLSPLPTLAIRMNETNNGDGQTDTMLSMLAPLRVQVFRNNAPAAGVDVYWSVWLGQGTMSARSSATAKTDASGMSSVLWTLGPFLGRQEAQAFIAGNSAPVTFTATATAVPPPRTLSVMPAPTSGDGQTDTARATLADPLRVLVTRNSVPAPGVAVLWTATLGGGSVSAITTTDAAGLASAAWTLGSAAGLQTVVASVRDAAGSPVRFSANAASVSNTIAANGGDGQTDSTRATLPGPLSVRVTRRNVPAPGVAVLWSATVGGGSVSASTTTTDSAGIASVRWTLGSLLGAQKAQASLAGAESSPVIFTATATSPRGGVRFTARTTGSDLDTNGYLACVDPDEYYGCWNTSHLGINGTTTIAPLSVGAHTVELDDVADNCTVGAPNPRVVQVTTGDTTDVLFDVTCSTAARVQVTVATTGADLDPDGYQVQLERPGYSRPAGIAINGVVVFAGLAAGDYTVRLNGVATNCTVAAPNPAAVTVAAGDTARVAFAVTCAPLATIQVTVATTGVDPDSNGYYVQAGQPGFAVGALVAPSGVATISQLAPGVYTVTLLDVAVSCDVAAPQAVTVTVASGDAAVVRFSVGCTPATRLAFSSNATGNAEIFAVNSNGTGLTRLTVDPAGDDEAAWSPDGTRIAFTSGRSGNPEIYLMGAGGSGVVRLTSQGAADMHPAWSPDATRIAFASERDGNREIYLMNADGSGQVRLTVGSAVDDDPTWSPDGSRIAFTSFGSGNQGVYVMNADGSNMIRLSTGDNAGTEPAWSPDGTRIAFSRFIGCDYYTCDYDLYVMNADGSGVTQLTMGSAVAETGPTWSPDGRWIAFTAQACDWYYGCYAVGIQAIRADGTDTRVITNGYEYNPAWRR